MGAECCSSSEDNLKAKDNQNKLLAKKDGSQNNSPVFSSQNQNKNFNQNNNIKNSNNSNNNQNQMKSDNIYNGKPPQVSQYHGDENKNSVVQSFNGPANKANIDKAPFLYNSQKSDGDEGGFFKMLNTLKSYNKDDEPDIDNPTIIRNDNDNPYKSTDSDFNLFSKNKNLGNGLNNKY